MNDFVALSMMALIVGGLIGVIIYLSQILGPKSTSPIKEEPFETGERPFKIMRSHVPVKFYLVALLFVVFDVETIFLFPWAVKFKAFGLFGLLEMLIFLAILIVGYIWVWKKGALEWV